MWRLAAKVAAAVSLLALYLSTLLAVAHPNVGPEYKAYYVDRVLADWEPHRYAAKPDDGISFGAPGLPAFVRGLYGFSRRESWGRWTDANHSPRAADGTPVAQVVLVEAVTGAICLDVQAKSASWASGNPVRVSFGQEMQTIQLGQELSENFLEFHLSENADTIEFKPSGILGPNSMLGMDIASDQQHPHSLKDHRRELGIARLRILHGSCTSRPSPDNSWANQAKYR